MPFNRDQGFSSLVEIEDLAARAIEFIASAETSKSDEKEKFFHPLRPYAVERMEELRNHFSYNSKPESILEKDRPMEREEVRGFRLESYEPITYSESSRVLLYLQRLFNPALSKVNFSESEIESPLINTGESARDYLTKSLPAYGSIMSFLRDVVLNKMVSDPNGYLVMWTDVPDDELNPRELQKPYPKYLASDRIIWVSDNALLSESDMEHEYQYEGDIQYGKSWFLFTKDVTLYIAQKSPNIDFENLKESFEFGIWNRHFSGKNTWIQLGGKPASYNDQTLTPVNSVALDSHLQAAVPYWNRLISLDSDQSANFLMHIYLQKWEEELSCPTCDGVGHHMHYEGTSPMPVKKTCQSCHGTGIKAGGSPFDTILVNRDNQDGRLDPTPPAGYIQLPTDIINVVEAKLDKLREQALEAINMGFLTKKETSQPQSAASKREDKDALYTMLENISFDLFKRIGNWVIDTVASYRYSNLITSGQSIGSYQVPNSFDIETAQEAVNLIDTLKGGNRSILAEATKRFATKQFGRGTIQERKSHTAIDFDPAFGLSTEDLEDASTTFTRVEKTLSYHIKDIVNELSLDPAFLDLPYSEKKELIYNKARELQGQKDSENAPLEDLNLDEI